MVGEGLHEASEKAGEVVSAILGRYSKTVTMLALHNWGCLKTKQRLEYLLEMWMER